MFECKFAVESDHELLEDIKYENLVGTPVCLQHILSKDVTNTYHPVKEMLLANSLSCYDVQSRDTSALDVTIPHVR